MMPISKQRVAKIDDDAAVLAVHVVGAPGEVMTLHCRPGASTGACTRFLAVAPTD